MIQPILHGGVESEPHSGEYFALGSNIMSGMRSTQVGVRTRTSVTIMQLNRISIRKETHDRDRRHA
jgi:hypothetical protein